MKIDEYELNRELDFMHEAGGASSAEDFWMFLSFAMVLISFVLMGYVSYLKKLEVDTVKKMKKLTEMVQQQEAASQPENEVNIYLRENEEDGIYLTFDDDLSTKIKHDQLSESLHSRIQGMQESPIVFNVYSPGEYYFKEVMEICFIIDSLESVKGKGGRGRILNLIYEEELEE